MLNIVTKTEEVELSMMDFLSLIYLPGEDEKSLSLHLALAVCETPSLLCSWADLLESFGLNISCKLIPYVAMSWHLHVWNSSWGSLFHLYFLWVYIHEEILPVMFTKWWKYSFLARQCNLSIKMVLLNLIETPFPVT